MLESHFNVQPNRLRLEKVKTVKQVKHAWTECEESRFLEALRLFGPKRLKEIAARVETRSHSQVRSHLQKHMIREERRKN